MLLKRKLGNVKLLRLNVVNAEQFFFIGDQSKLLKNVHKLFLDMFSALSAVFLFLRVFVGFVSSFGCSLFGRLFGFRE